MESEKKYVYLVIEREGTYEDYWEHIVKAFTDKDKAEKMAEEIDKIHEEMVKFPIDCDRYDFLAFEDDCLYTLDEEHPEFDENNNWSDEDLNRYLTLLHQEMMSRDDYPNVTLEQVKQVWKWQSDGMGYKEYHKTKVKEVELE